jgi:hypothetical protein
MTALQKSLIPPLLDAFVEHDGNSLDTAQVYADWIPNVPRSVSERTFGQWLIHGETGLKLSSEPASYSSTIRS